MSFFNFGSKNQLPTADSALPGRDQAMPVPAAHYVNGNPLKYVDPDGRDAIYVNFPSYPINVPGTTMQVPLGHAAVISVDEKTGATRYYEYGRYDSDFGNVERRSVPNLAMGTVSYTHLTLPTSDLV